MISLTINFCPQDQIIGNLADLPAYNQHPSMQFIGIIRQFFNDGYPPLALLYFSVPAVVLFSVIVSTFCIGVLVAGAGSSSCGPQQFCCYGGDWIYDPIVLPLLPSPLLAFGAATASPVTEPASAQ
jgi:hypothetical protein